jgi:aldehyde dehydrogenase (NAD+)
MNHELLGSGALIIGETRQAETSLGRVDHVNPHTGRVQADFAIGGEPEVAAAVHAAREALPGWRAWNAGERRDVLLRVADLITANAEELGAIAVEENGTPISFAALVAGQSPAEWFRYYAGWVDKLEGSVAPTYPNQSLNYTRHEPYGVIGAIIAFNAPASFVGFKAAPALAAGNTVVLKPSELAPWTTLRMAELMLEAGIPPGVVNVVPGDGRTGHLLASHPGIDKISFTGGLSAAEQILQSAAKQLTPCSMELGGKSAVMVFDDADLGAAIAIAAQGGFVIQSGQACVAGTRIFAHRSIYPDFVAGLQDMANTVVVGDPHDDSTMMGPLISERHCNRVLGVINDAVDSGAGKLLTGGTRVNGDLSAGYYVSPAIFADVDLQSRLAREEIFGPVVVVTPFDSDEEVIAEANNSRFGLAGYIFTRDARRMHRMAAELQAGYISVNTINLMPPNAPFGGFKSSGFGREGGREGLLEMSQVKNVNLSLE